MFDDYYDVPKAEAMDRLIEQEMDAEREHHQSAMEDELHYKKDLF